MVVVTAACSDFGVAGYCQVFAGTARANPDATTHERDIAAAAGPGPAGERRKLGVGYARNRLARTQEGDRGTGRILTNHELEPASLAIEGVRAEFAAAVQLHRKRTIRDGDV